MQALWCASQGRPVDGRVHGAGQNGPQPSPGVLRLAKRDSIQRVERGKFEGHPSSGWVAASLDRKTGETGPLAHACGIPVAGPRAMTKPLCRWRNTASVAVLLLAALASACATASGVRLGMERFEPRPVDHEVPIYESLRELPRPFLKVGRIVGEGSDLVEFESIVTKMQQRARQLGGDALVITGGGLLLLKGGDFGIDVDRTVHALAVRWQDLPKTAAPTGTP